MKKIVMGLLVWNVILTLAIGSCFYTFKYHLAAIVKTVDNVSGLISITKEFSKQQEKIVEIINVATILGDIPIVETVNGDVTKGMACNRIFTPEEIAKYRLKTMPIGSQTVKIKPKDIFIRECENSIPFKIHPTERK